MPGHLQEGFGCVGINCFDQLFDDKSDPFEVLKAAESSSKKKGGGPVTPGQGSEASKTAMQAAKQLHKESQKERKNPLPDKEEAPAPVPLKKEGIRRVGRSPDQQQPQQAPPQELQQPQAPQAPQGEGKPIDRRQTDRRPPCERRFEKPVEEKAESGEFSVDRPIIDRPPRGRGGPGGRGRGGRGHGIGRGDGFNSRGKCEFDRHSGSDQAGPKHEDKRGGSESHNWGNVKDELSKLDQSTVTKEAPEAEEQPVVDSENKENEAGEGPKEEGPKEMTLDEWKAVQDKESNSTFANQNKGSDGQWKKGFVLHKSKNEEVHAESDAFDHHFHKPANDITSQLEINFGDLGRPGRSGRGGRGGCGRGARTTCGGKIDKSSDSSAPDVDDSEAFPALV